MVHDGRRRLRERWCCRRGVGIVRAGAFGHSLGAPCGIAEVKRDEPITASALAAGTFEIDIAGTRVPTQVSLKPFFDPDRTRILH
jgi:glycine cleavage system aminomethyltransferase T